MFYQGNDELKKMKPNYHVFPCSKCGDMVERHGLNRIATCFNCKVERLRRNAKAKKPVRAVQEKSNDTVSK